MLPEWLKDAAGKDEAVSLTSLPLPDLLLLVSVRLAVAFLLGCLAAGIYRLTIRNRESSEAFLATLVLLSVLIAVVTLVIGSSVALAFSLVGALSIVRFRTVVEDTRDTAFVIYAVITGMAAGSGRVSFLIPLMASPLVLLAAWLFRPREVVAEQKRGLLILRLAAVKPPEEPVRAALERHLGGGRLTGLSTARGGSALDVTYSVSLPTPEVAVALLAELGRIEGVHGVELKER